MMKPDLSHQQRQEALAAHLSEPVLLVLTTGSEQHTQGAQYAPFKPHTHAYYLSGLNEPDVALFLWLKKPGLLTRAVFITDPEPEKKVWSDVKSLSPNHPALQGYDQVFSARDKEALQSWLSQIPSDTPCLALDLTPEIAELLGDRPTNPEPLHQALAQLRSIKEPAEIELIAQAAQISADGHAALASCWDKSEEMEWEGVWRAHCWAHGAKQQAYLPIMGSGERSCCLHYHANNASLNGCDWILVDAGCEWQYYASDITRTFFRSGSGTMVQTVYEKLLDLQKRLCAGAVIGSSLATLEEQARSEMAQWLQDWGWVTGSFEQRLQAVKKYFSHRLGHHLGLDVHDCSKHIPVQTPFEPGMVITIEPGFYCSPLLLEDSHPLLGLGIRIEDNIVITEGTPRILTEAAPKEWHAVCSDS